MAADNRLDITKHCDDLIAFTSDVVGEDVRYKLWSEVSPVLMRLRPEITAWCDEHLSKPPILANLIDAAMFQVAAVWLEFTSTADLIAFRLMWLNSHA
jgi:hypothetical protein